MGFRWHRVTYECRKPSTPISVILRTWATRLNQKTIFWLSSDQLKIASKYPIDDPWLDFAGVHIEKLFHYIYDSTLQMFSKPMGSTEESLNLTAIIHHNLKHYNLELAQGVRKCAWTAASKIFICYFLIFRNVIDRSIDCTRCHI